MYRLGKDGTVYNRFRLQIANRGHEQAVAQFAMEGLPGAKFADFENAIVVDAGQTVNREVEIAELPQSGLAAGVNHFRLVSKVGNDREIFEETFITPSNE